MTESHARLLRRLKRERLHIERGAVEASPPRVRRCFAHAWAPADLLLDHLRGWPKGLIEFWLAAPAGHVLFTAGTSAYVPATVTWHHQDLQAVARVGLADLLEIRPALETVAHLVDHLLGSLGARGGPWLSDGVGATPDLATAAQRVRALLGLGYGPDDPHAYFAWAFAGYWTDRRVLNTADPQVERLLRSTLASEAFWARGA